MDDVTLSRVNLYAVLRTLEKLPDVDEESRNIISGVHEVIQFVSPAGSARVAINDGTITHHRGKGPNTINLAFPTPKMLNKMFAGTGFPIPTKGFRKLNFLTGPFTQLTDRLSHYLQPEPADLENKEFADKNALLTLHIAVYALAEIGNSDAAGKLSAGRMVDGDIQLAVRGGPALILRVQDHHLKVVEGISENRRAKMIFADIESAGQVLRGELASYTAIGRDLLHLGGYVPLLDNMNKILSLVPRYLG